MLIQPIRPALGFAVAGLLLMLVGCSATPTQDKPTVAQAVFIPATAPPRLQFLMSFSDGRYKESGPRGSFSEWVVGTKKTAATASRINSPYGMDIRNGRAYICDVGTHTVHVVDFASKKYSQLESPTTIVNPVNITIDQDGTKYLCDSGKNRIMVFDAHDRFVREFGNPAEWTPLDVAIKGDKLYIADVTGGKIDVWTKQGEKITSFSSKGDDPEQLKNPTNLTFGPDGLLYVTDTGQQTVKVFNDQGRLLSVIGGPGTSLGRFARPKGIVTDPQGHIYVADAQWDVVQIFDPSGQLLLVFGAPGGEPHSMGMPAGLAIDSTSLEYFRQYIDPRFQAEYLLFVVNQFGANKVAVYAFGSMPNWQPPPAPVTPEAAPATPQPTTTDAPDTTPPQ